MAYAATAEQEKFCQSAYKMSCEDYFLQNASDKEIDEKVKQNQEQECKNKGYSSCAEYDKLNQFDDAKVKDLGTEPLKDARSDQCIKEINADGSTGPDEGYLVTVIEEPLLLEEYGVDQNGNPTSDKASKLCYRNTFSYVDPLQKRHTHSEFSRICSPNGQKLFNNTTLRQKYKLEFACQEVQVLLSKGGTSTIENYISTIYRWAAGVVGLIAVVIIIGSGIQISASGGDQEAVTKAKERIVKSLSGIALLFLSGVILYTINPTFFIR